MKRKKAFSSKDMMLKTIQHENKVDVRGCKEAYKQKLENSFWQ